MNTKQAIKSYSKDEPRPKFINSALEDYYNQTDLTLTWVYDCCLTLKPLKGIDVNEQQVQFWFIEFIKMGWKKRDFDKQFEAVKRATLYNRIDFETWVKTEMMYNEIDFNVKLDKTINDKIQYGGFLSDYKHPDCNFNEDQKRDISLYETNLIKKRYEREQLEANEDWVKQERIRIKKELILGKAKGE